MACPAGYTAESLKEPQYEKPFIFPTIAEPNELKKFVDDGIFLLGGQYAILCQFAHPGLAQGTFEHSNFASRLLNRLQTTARFLNAAVMGTLEEKQAIFSVIHSAHSVVKGDSYTADDPELHKWTAATLFMALIAVQETFFGKLSREKKEVLFKESAVYGTSLRMPPEMWPATLDDFYAYWNHNIQTLEITGWAKSLCKDLMYPKHLPLWMKPLTPTMRLLTMGWLPERLGREYDLVMTPGKLGLYHLVAGYMTLVYPYFPRRLKTLPSRRYIKDLKKSVKVIEEKGTW